MSTYIYDVDSGELKTKDTLDFSSDSTRKLTEVLEFHFVELANFLKIFSLKGKQRSRK